MSDDYFHRVHRETPTRVWVNNPTAADADRAFALGARSATTNPTYASKILPTLPAVERRGLLADSLSLASDPAEAVDAVQRALVSRILPLFARHSDPERPLDGLVSIQGDPHRDTDSDHILHEAERHRRLGPNIICKIPATRAGLVAIEDLLRRDVPVLATEMMTLAQTRAACAVYRRVAKATGRRPLLIVTHITGIFDEYLADVARREAPALAAEDLAEAGFLVARRVRIELNRQGLPITLMGGGARAERHFTDMVGGELQVTINPDTITTLAGRTEVAPRFDTPIDREQVERLRALPDFRRAWDATGLSVEEFESYGPVRFFLGMFTKGWDAVRAQLEPAEQASGRA